MRNFYESPYRLTSSELSTGASTVLRVASKFGSRDVYERNDLT